MTSYSRSAICALLLAFAVMFAGGSLAAQKAKPKPKADVQFTASPAGVMRGGVTFRERCAICHFGTSRAQKVGPGLQGIFRRGKYVSGKPVTDASMQRWITGGSSEMPAYGKILTVPQIRDLIEYLKTL